MVNVLMHLQPGEQIHGEISRGASEPLGFVGWHELVSTLERLRAEQPPGGQAGPSCPTDRSALGRELIDHIERPLMLADLKLRAALGLLDAEPGRARSLLVQLQPELGQARHQLRELARRAR
jgi:hypothetical protein